MTHGCIDLYFTNVAMFRMHLFCVLLALTLCVQCKNDKSESSPLAELVRRSVHPITRSCVTRVGATEADLLYIRGEPPYPRNTACIMQCLFEKIGLVKGGNYSKQGFLNAITPLLLGNKKKMEHMHGVASTCDKEISRDGKPEECDVGNEIVTCIFKHAPELHIKVK